MSLSTAFTKYSGATLGVAWTSFVTDALVVDTMVAGFGGFVAMAAGKTLRGRLWEGVIGLAMGLGVALLMRSGEFSDIVIRLGIFVSAILGTKTVEFIRSPEGLKAIGSWLKKILTAAIGK
ncbi:MAG: hypothetical protein HRT61_01140 [Ekhidna sp.]|nr:hypothetical protein [Ekhidna sp.]